MSDCKGDAVRLAIVVSHPIQHFIPFYRALAAYPGLELKVFFGSAIGVKTYFDAEMNKEISWKMDLLSGYPSEFLPEAAHTDSSAPLAFNNPSIWRALTEFKPDAVMLYGYSHVTPFRALAWCKMNDALALMIGDSELRRPRSAPLAAFKAVALRAIFSQIDAFLTVGDNNEIYLSHYGVPKTKLFRSPFTIDEVSYRAARRDRAALRAAFRSRHGIGEDELVALFVGKLSERKRPADLLSATEGLKSKGLNLRCVFAGDGQLAESLATQARDSGLNALFLGFLNVDMLPEAYCSADILVHPSVADPHPLVCSEAACIGLPMVLSDRVGAEGSTDIARAGVNAAVYPCGDTAALASILESLARNPRRLEQMSANSLAIFDELDVNRSIQGVIDALGERAGAQAIQVRESRSGKLAA